MVEATEAIPKRRFTITEYHRMAETGILKPGERVELIRGVVHRLSPKNHAHVVAVAKVLKRLMSALEGRAGVYPEAPLEIVGLDSEPEPDILVTASPVLEDYGTSEPVLVVEVAESSLRYDLDTKASLYAAAGVPQYWVVNLVDGHLVAFRSPHVGVYRDRTIHHAEDRVSIGAWSDVSIRVADLLPSGL